MSKNFVSACGSVKTPRARALLFAIAFLEAHNAPPESVYLLFDLYNVLKRRGGNPPRPTGTRHKLAVLAAAVTALKPWYVVDAAVAEVATRGKADRKEIRNFRNCINRGKARSDDAECYSRALAIFNGKPKSEILAAVKREGSNHICT
jgi:hypothetical protein